MNNREFKVKEISDELTKIEIQVRNLNFQNLNDLNILLEVLFCNILNIAFGYNLINMNGTSMNFPAIDLADDENRIAVQISSTKTKAKIQKTLDSFVENNYHEMFDKLIFLVIGEKQKKYLNLKLSDKFSFDVIEDIIDFKTLLRSIAFLPIEKIDNILTCLQSEQLSASKINKKGDISRTRFKQIQSLKKKIEKELLRDFTTQNLLKYREQLYYNPSLKFLYTHLIVRSIADKSFPGGDPKGIQGWHKSEIWDFYDDGIEFVHLCSQYVVIEDDESWYFVDNKNQKSQGCCLFLRISFENIVSLDMEPDGYYGYPTLYVEMTNDNNLYSKMVYGLIGYYKTEKPSESRMTYYLDENKQKNVCNLENKQISTSPNR